MTDEEKQQECWKITLRIEELKRYRQNEYDTLQMHKEAVNNCSKSISSLNREMDSLGQKRADLAKTEFDKNSN